MKVAEELQDTAPAGWLDFRFQCPKLNNGLVEELEQYVGDNPECKLIVIDTLLMITPRMNDSPSARIGEDLDIDFWTLLEESRIIQAG